MRTVQVLKLLISFIQIFQLRIQFCTYDRRICSQFPLDFFILNKRINTSHQRIGWHIGCRIFRVIDILSWLQWWKLILVASANIPKNNFQYHWQFGQIGNFTTKIIVLIAIFYTHLSRRTSTRAFAHSQCAL